MFRNEFESLQGLLSEGHKLVTQSVLFFGFLLVILGGLIFMFPAIIGTLFAIFIFLAGLFVLVSGYYFWQIKADKSDNLNSIDAEVNFIKSGNNRPRYYRFQNIRFIRW